MGPEQTGRSGRPGSQWVGFVLALVLGAATYAAWLGWDTEYYYDASVGAYQGPYRPLQVVGCALTFAVVTALLAMRWRPLIVAAGTSLGFWLPWTIQAARQDETGLFMVGSMLLIIALAAGSAVASLIGHRLRPP
ncbi:MAG: hypothetical protein Q4G67_13795 [Actinomycetia bacterium]|nr:hypothetical protein [Actinomycetes bacterium]